MILLPLDELKILLTERPGLCVSIFMPTHTKGAETKQDPIRFTNLLRQAEERLVESGARPVDAQRLLEPAHKLHGYSPFWRHLSDGLALFLAPGIMRYYPVPLKFEEQLVVAENFYLKPLLPLLSGDGRFYVLALSQNETRLLQGSRYSINQLDLEDVPENIDEALGDRIRERQLQFHTRASGGAGRRPVVFFGHGGSDERERQDLLKYFRQVDEGLRDLLLQESAPLVLAGVDYLLPIYHEANTYSHLVEEGIKGNPEELSPSQLHRRAWKMVEPLFTRARSTAQKQYHQLAGTERASNDIATIVAAAHHGRVESLFAALGVQRWGSYDPQKDRAELNPTPQAGDEDLLQYACLHTLLNGGEVYVVEQDQMPEQVEMAAVFRY